MTSRPGLRLILCLAVICLILSCSETLEVDITPPARVTDIRVTELTMTHVRLAWTAPGDNIRDGTAAEYDIRYSVSGLSGSAWDNAVRCEGEPAPAKAGTGESFYISGLLPNITYCFALRARDDAGNWSELSDIVCATTPGPDESAPAAVKNLEAGAPTRSTLTLSWTATGDDSLSGRASYYDLRYSTSPIDTLTWQTAVQYEGEPQPTLPGVTDTVAVGGLTYETTYYFVIKVADEARNWSDLSNAAEGSTLPPADLNAPAAINDLAVEHSDSTHVTLRWTATGDDSLEGTAALYDIRYSTFPIDASTWPGENQCQAEPTPQPAGSQETYVAGDLWPKTTYYFAARVFDEAGHGSALSNMVEATTGSLSDTVPPAAVYDLTAEALGSASVSLRWTATGNDSLEGTAALYDIRFSTSPINESSWTTASQCVSGPSPGPTGSEETYIVDELIPEAKHYFALKVSDGIPNWSGLSNLAEATTLEAPPGINDLDAGLYAGTSVHLRWTAPGQHEGSGLPAEYDIRYSTARIDACNWGQATELTGEPEPAEPGTVQDCIAHRLGSDTRYYFAMKVRYGESMWSALSNVTRYHTADCEGTGHNPYLSLGGARGVSSDSIRVSFETYGGFSPVCDIRYSTRPIDDWSWSSARRAGCTPIWDHEASSHHWNYYYCYITGLRGGTTYYVGLRAGRGCEDVLQLASATTRGPEDPDDPDDPDYPEIHLKLALHIEDHLERRTCSMGLPSFEVPEDITNRVDRELPCDIDVFVVAFGTGSYTGIEYGLDWPAGWGWGMTRACAYTTMGSITEPGDGMRMSWGGCEEIQGFRVLSWTWLAPGEPGWIVITPHPQSAYVTLTDCAFEPAWPESLGHAAVNADPPVNPLQAEGRETGWNGVQSILK